MQPLLHPRSTPRHGFTLLELLTVIGIIIVLAAMILGGMGYANNKAASSRAAAEIGALSALIDAFKSDFGDVPRTSENEAAQPFPITDNFIPDAQSPVATYEEEPQKKRPIYDPYSGLLTHYLFGGSQPNVPASSNAAIASWSRKNSWPMNSFSSNTVTITLPSDNTTQSVTTRFIIDPFGSSYGYSTHGKFNPLYDLWSYGGVVPKDESGADLKDPDGSWVKFSWIKNW